MQNIANHKGKLRENARNKTEVYQKIEKDKKIKLLMTQKRLEGLKDSLNLLDIFINNRHMEMLSPASEYDLYSSKVVGLNEFKKNRTENISIHCLNKIMYNEDEDNFEKLVSVYSAMYGFGGIIGTIIQSDGKFTKLYLCTNTNKFKDFAGGLISSNIRGQFPGSELVELNDYEKNNLLSSFSDDVTSSPKTVVRSLSIIPGRREEEQKKGRDFTTQGYEKFIDTMSGKKYTLVILAQKVSSEAMDLSKNGFEDMYTSLSPYAKEQASFAESETDTLNFTISNGISYSTSKSISNSYGTSHTNSISQSRGKNSGMSSSWNGLGFSNGSSWSISNSTSTGQTFNNGETNTDQEAKNLGETQSSGKTYGTTKTISVSRDNKSVIDMLEKLDVMIKRIQSSQLFGMWNTSCYIITQNDETAITATSTLTSLLAGDNKVSSYAYINEWNNKNKNERNKVLDYIGNLYHPEIELDMYKEVEGNKVALINEEGKKINTQILTPALMVSGKEMPIILGLPNKSVPGIVVDNMAEFGRNIPDKWKSSIRRPIDFGNIYHMGVVEATPTVLNLDSFSSHCFICGASGSGKSNTTYNLLYEMIQNEIPFLVIEPAKGEYHTEFGGLKNINIFTAEDSVEKKLQINPFEFNPKIHIREHLDRLSSTVCACWPLYGAMPGLLKQAFEKVYIDHGWDLEYSQRIVDIGSKYPTFKDLENALNTIIDESPYSSESKGDYKGALLNRVSSLNNGFEGQIFGNSIGISDKILFDSNTIIDLSSIGSDETKSLIMGIMIIRLQEYRKATRKDLNSSLKHITVLEEAHNILKRCSQDTNVESGNMQGQSVKMLCNCIAEMRSFGEGFMIIDQSPSVVDETAIKNTAIKIAMRLPNKEDCEIMGAALSLNQKQIKELSRLDIGVAAIFHVGWTNTLLAKMGKVWNRKIIGEKKHESYNRNAYIKVSGAVVQYIYHRIKKKDLYYLREETIDLIELISEEGEPNALPITKQEELIGNVNVFFEDNINIIKNNDCKALEYRIIDFIFNFLKLKSLFRIVGLTGVNPNMTLEPLNQIEKTIALKWESKIRDIIGKYLVMPKEVSPKKKYYWSSNPVQSEYFIDIFRDLIFYYGSKLIYEKDDYSYLNAFDYLDKLGVFKE